MSAVLAPANFAAPQVLVVDLVRVLRGDLDAFGAVDWVRAQRSVALPSPGFETGSVRVVADVGDHEVGEVTILVGQCVEQAVVVVDNLFCQFNGRVVTNSDLRGLGSCGRNS